jgi:hypothetical protein
MAEATFNIRAVDSTRQAFASVQNNLNRLSNTAEKAGKKIQQSFSIQRGISMAMVALGLSMDAIAEKISNVITGTNKEELDAQAKNLQLMQQQAAAAEALAVAKRTDAQQLLALNLEAEQIQSRIANNSADTTEQSNRLLQDQIALSQTRLNILTLGRKIDEDQLATQQAYKESLQDLGAAQSRIYTGQASLADRILGIRGREATILKDMASIGADDIELRTEKIKELTQVYEKLAPLLEEQRRLGREAGDMIAMGFEDAIFSGEKLSAVLKNLALDLMRLIFRNVITAPLASSIGNFINAGLGFLAKGGPAKAGSPYIVGEQGPELFVPGISGTVVPNSKIARIMASMSGSLDFLAKGGPAKAGSPYIVGEQGPELFVPGSSGTVIPNDRMGQMGSAVGGPNINISYNIQSGVSRAELQPILEQERKRLMVTIPDLVRRGGSYRSAFA